MPRVEFTKSVSGSVRDEVYELHINNEERQALSFDDNDKASATLDPATWTLDIEFAGNPGSAVSYVIDDGTEEQKRRVKIPDGEYSVDTFREFDVQ
ncbi:MAG: hypothetical protein ACKVS5_07605 [Parvularculaceae bacterium]